MKRNYLLFCNHIAFCSIGILATLIIGSQNKECQPYSEWSASLFSYSGVSYTIPAGDSHGDGINNSLSYESDQLENEDQNSNRLVSLQSPKQSSFLAYTYNFIFSLSKNIFSKLIYHRITECSKDFFSGIPLYGAELSIIETVQHLNTDALLSAEDFRRSKGFASIVKIPDKPFT